MAICQHCDRNIQDAYYLKLVEEAKMEEINLQLEKEQLEKLVKQMQTNLQNSQEKNCNTMQYQIKLENEQHSDDEFAEIEEFYWDANDPATQDVANQTREVQVCQQVKEIQNFDFIRENHAEPSSPPKSEQTTLASHKADDFIILLNSDEPNKAELELLVNEIAKKLKENHQSRTIDFNVLIKKFDAKKFHCRLCKVSKDYSWKSTVLYHIKTMHFGLRYICVVCNAKFVDLKHHYLVQHNAKCPDNPDIDFYEHPIIFQDSYLSTRQIRRRYPKKSDALL